MPESPALEEFRRLVGDLRRDQVIAAHTRRGEVHFGELSIEDVARLLRKEPARYFLLAAAGMNRTSLKKEASSETAQRL